MTPAQGQTAVDISRWNRKVDDLLREYGPTVAKIVAYANTRVAGAVAQNLSGSAYYPGRLPVRRVTGTLARSYRVDPVNAPYLFMHRMDSSVANYAKFVHEGTRYLKPRPYFRNAFDSNRQAIMNYWRYQFILEMRRRGQA
jgi:hypothetical protein